MTDSADQEELKRVLAELRALGAVPAVATPLESALEPFLGKLYDAVTREVAAYSESGNPDVLPELRQHLEDHLAAICQLLAGERARFEFVVRHAERRASQKFPLDAILQAYRCLHRLAVPWIRDTALANADTEARVNRVVAAVTNFTIEYTGTIGTLITSSYVSHTRMLAEAEGDRRTRLLDTLLNGYDESDQQAAQLLRRAGYLQQRQSYCVLVAQSVNPEEMQSAARAQRMADAIAKELASTPLRVSIGIRDNLVVAILSGTRRLSGWTAPQSLIADRAYPHLRRVGPAALIGVSSDVPSTSHIPRALEEARLALDHASVGERVVSFSNIPFRQMLIAEARSDIQSALPAWLDDFNALDRRAKGSLSATLSAYADCDMNVLQAAKKLLVHPNTIYARVQRIEEATGMNPLQYHALTEMLLAIECSRSA